MSILIRFWPLIAATVLYIAQLGIFLWTRQWGAAMTFGGYALANIGLIWSMS
jgi:hypothetical protein